MSTDRLLKARWFVLGVLTTTLVFVLLGGLWLRPLAAREKAVPAGLAAIIVPGEGSSRCRSTAPTEAYQTGPQASPQPRMLSAQSTSSLQAQSATDGLDGSRLLTS